MRKKQSTEKLQIIDAHQHAFWHRRDAAGLVRDLDEQRIAQAWLLTWEVAPEEDVPEIHGCLNPVRLRPDGTHPGLTFEDQLLAKQQFPDRFLLGYCPHPARSNPAELFEAAYHMYGVRICGEWKFRMLIDDPRCLELFRKAGALKCPVVLHLDVPWLPDAKTGKPVYQKNWYGGTVLNLERALQACPDTVFLGHAPGFWREISADADTQSNAYPQSPRLPGGRLERLFAEYPNLWADLSAGSALNALKRDPAFSRDFLCRYQDRVLFARDYYGGDLDAFLQTLKLPAKVKTALYSGNARRLIM